MNYVSMGAFLTGGVLFGYFTNIYIQLLCGLSMLLYVIKLNNDDGGGFTGIARFLLLIFSIISAMIGNILFILANYEVIVWDEWVQYLFSLVS